VRPFCLNNVVYIVQDKLYYLNDLKVEEITDETGQVAFRTCSASLLS